MEQVKLDENDILSETIYVSDPEELIKQLQECKRCSVVFQNYFSLDFQSIDIQKYQEDVRMSIQNMKQLTKFYICGYNCALNENQISNLLYGWLPICDQLQHINLNFCKNCCQGMLEMVPVFIGDCKNAVSMCINFSENQSLCLNDLFAAFQKTKRLQSLHLILSRCEEISLTQQFYLPQSLQYFSLDLCKNKKVTEQTLKLVLESLKQCRNLKALSLNFSGLELSNEVLKLIGSTFNHMRNLYQLEIRLQNSIIDDKKLKNLLCGIYQKAEKIKKFMMDISKNQIKLEGIKALNQTIIKMNQLNNLQLSIWNNQLKNDHIELLLENFGSLEYLTSLSLILNEDINYQVKSVLIQEIMDMVNLQHFMIYPNIDGVKLSPDLKIKELKYKIEQYDFCETPFQSKYSQCQDYNHQVSCCNPYPFLQKYLENNQQQLPIDQEFSDKYFVINGFVDQDLMKVMKQIIKNNCSTPILIFWENCIKILPPELVYSQYLNYSQCNIF